MRSYLLLILFTLLIINHSCVTFHGGNYQHGVVLTEGNYKYVKKVSTTETLTYFLFWGGNQKTKLLNKMREDVYLNAELDANQDLTNFLVTSDQSFFLYFS
jgi:hypothetical protein